MSFNSHPVIYLDENATATPYPPALELMYKWMKLGPSNASSVHQAGRRGRGAIEKSRRRVAESLGVNARHLTFCSGATEAIHQIILGYLKPSDHVIVSAVEHPAIWGALNRLGIEYSIVPVNDKGEINPFDFTRLIQPNTRLGIMMYAQNEIGTIYPIQEVAQALGKIPLLCDAVQAWGKLPLNLEECGAQFAVVSGHKIGGPMGVGVIWCKGGSTLNPLLQGGAQERGRRAGTENIASIVGLEAAVSAIPSRLAAMEKVRALKESLQSRLSLACPELQFVGISSASTLPNTLCMVHPRLMGDLMLQRLDLLGICISSGSACSSGAFEPSPILLALGLSEELAKSGLRVSLGPNTIQEDIDRFIDVFVPLCEELTQTSLSSF